MASKLSIINDCLANTANARITQAQLDQVPSDSLDANDALFLADTAARGYNRELALLLQRHPWPFGLATEALDQAAEAENPSNRYGYAYDWPYGALWLKTVESPGGGALDYEILGQYICADYDGTDDDAPVASFVQTPPVADISELFWAVLRIKLEVVILRSVNEDYSEATRRDQIAEGLVLPIVRTRTDQQQPPRRGFRSTMREARRTGGSG
jgi:hypothetical protein